MQHCGPYMIEIKVTTLCDYCGKSTFRENVIRANISQRNWLELCPPCAIVLNKTRKEKKEKPPEVDGVYQRILARKAQSSSYLKRKLK